MWRIKYLISIIIIENRSWEMEKVISSSSITFLAFQWANCVGADRRQLFFAFLIYDMASGSIFIIFTQPVSQFGIQ